MTVAFGNSCLAQQPSVVVGRGARQRSVEHALAVAPYRDGNRKVVVQGRCSEARPELPCDVVIEPGKDQPVLLGKQHGQQFGVALAHAVGICTTAPVAALVRAAASSVPLATASRGSTGGGLVPRTAPAKAG